MTHGLSLSLGGPAPLDETFLRRLRQFLAEHDIRCYSEHLSYCSDDGHLYYLETPYPGGNLFSLASGGAVFIRDAAGQVGEDQLNGGQFARFDAAHWELIRPLLQENERFFGIPISRLLTVEGQSLPPERIYRIVVPAKVRALQAEEAWVSHAPGRRG